jgi:hypothetical protein
MAAAASLKVLVFRNAVFNISNPTSVMAPQAAARGLSVTHGLTIGEWAVAEVNVRQTPS